jgi:hypothetical protein
MTISSFKCFRVSLTRAQNTCIAHVVELASQDNPAWADIQKAGVLVNQLKEILERGMDEFAKHNWRRQYPIGRMSALLKHGAIVLHQCLLIMNEALSRSYTRS